MIVAVVLIVFGVMKWLDVYTRHGEAVVVPDVKGMTVDEASKMFRNHGLVCVVSDSTYVKNKAAGIVLDANPGAGQKVKEQSAASPPHQLKILGDEGGGSGEGEGPACPFGDSSERAFFLTRRAYSNTLALVMSTAETGTSEWMPRVVVFSFSILSTASMPSMTLPNTQ